MTQRGVRLGRIFGIEVSADLGVLVIGGLLAWSLATAILPESDRGLSGATYWSIGLLGALLFLGSLLAHELAHSIVARRNGLIVEGVTLWLFGGVAQFRSEAEGPGAEFRIAAAGPATSLLIGGAGLASAYGLVEAGVPDVYAVMLFWLGGINLLLGIFNLLPGAPLDGGRVLASIVWKLRGDRLGAKIAAARAGRAVGLLIVAAGIAELVMLGSFGGLWTALIGWFLFGAARAEQARYQAEQRLGDLPVWAAMTRDPAVIRSWSSVRDLVEGPLNHTSQPAVPVVDVSGHLRGLATMVGVKRIPAEAWSGTQVINIAIPTDEVPTASPMERVMDVIDRLRPESGGAAVVVDDGTIVGLLGPDDLRRVLSNPGRPVEAPAVPVAAGSSGWTPSGPPSPAFAAPPPVPSDAPVQRWHAPTPPGGDDAI